MYCVAGEYIVSHLSEVVYSVGLPSHPQHELAKTEFKGYGGMVSFRIKGGLEQSQKFMQALKVNVEMYDIMMMSFTFIRCLHWLRVSEDMRALLISRKLGHVTYIT